MEFENQEIEDLFYGYAEALFWAETPAGEETGQTLEELGYGFNWDLSDSARASILAEVTRFYEMVKDRMPENLWVQAGSDLYFTRQSHGTGFWDRADMYGTPLADELTELVEREFSETYAWIEDGKVGVESYIPRTATVA